MENQTMLLPAIIDERARLDPSRLFCAQVKSENVDDGVLEITYGDFANAVNRCAWWLESEFGKAEDFETIAYAGPGDIRYAMITYAAVKTGRKAMLVSPINSIAGQLHLLEATQCKIFLTAKDFPPFKAVATAISAQREMRFVDVESQSYWLSDNRVEIYSFEATLEENPHRPFVIIHTSGSTGLPKPITHTFAAVSGTRLLISPKDWLPNAPQTTYDLWANRCIYMAFPVFHMVGILSTTVVNVYFNMVPILGPVGVPPTPNLASKIIKLDLCQAALLSPSVVEGIAKNDEQLEGLRKLDVLLWCGAPLSSRDIGDKLRSYVTILCAYGSTEMGPIPLTIEDQAHFEWVNFSPIFGATFRHFSEDLYELVVVRDPKLLEVQFIFHIFPELSEWPTKDLWSKHPTKDIWRYRGRNDDMIVLQSGLMINPLHWEGIVMSNPRVTAALLYGNGRANAAWLIEVKNPPADDNERVQLIEEIWPIVEKVNETAQAQVRAPREGIVFTTRGTPMARVGKGSVQRKLTFQTYEKELHAVT